MAPFEISQAEALLLGQSVGEFLHGKPSTRLLTHLRLRLAALVPRFVFLRGVDYCVMFHQDNPALTDFALVQIDDNTTLGACGNHPGEIIEIPLTQNQIDDAIRRHDLQSIRHVEMNPERKSLIDLVTVHFGDLLTLTPGECILRHVSRSPGFLNNWTDFVARFFKSPNGPSALASIVQRSKDNVPAVGEAIRDLAAKCNCAEAFEVGCSFGELAGILESEVQRLRSFDDEDSAELAIHIEESDYVSVIWDDILEADFYFPPIRPSVERLLRQPMIQRLRYGRDLLDSLHRSRFCYSPGLYELVGDEQVDVIESEMIRNLEHCQQRVWTAFGATLSALSDAQDEFDQRQLESLTPRTFSEVCESHPEAVVAEIQRLSRLLELPDFLPKDAVKIILAGAEGLVKRVWPSETNRENGVGRTIGDKLRSPRKFERRFARIANALWQEYRNCAAHDADFYCSYHETRHFLSAVRAMVDLADRIEAARTAGD